MKQQSLFDTPSLPAGLLYVEEFITPSAERELLSRIAEHVLTPAKYKEYVALRRTLHFGFGYDFDRNELTSAADLPDWLRALRAQVAAAAGLPAGCFVQALLTHYAPGTPLGWHRDVPDYEVIAGVSLAGAGRMRFRPYPHRSNKREHIIVLELPPRSLYVMRGDARWGWQHAISPCRSERYSITLRSLRAGCKQTD